jgi:hypothetical protein
VPLTLLFAEAQTGNIYTGKIQNHMSNKSLEDTGGNNPLDMP